MLKTAMSTPVTCLYLVLSVSPDVDFSKHIKLKGVSLYTLFILYLSYCPLLFVVVGNVYSSVRS